MQLSLAGAVAANRVDMDPSANHVVGQDGLHLFIRSRSCDDVSAFDCVFGCFALHDCDAVSRKIGRAFGAQPT